MQFYYNTDQVFTIICIILLYLIDYELPSFTRAVPRKRAGGARASSPGAHTQQGLHLNCNLLFLIMYFYLVNKWLVSLAVIDNSTFITLSLSTLLPRSVCNSFLERGCARNAFGLVTSSLLLDTTEGRGRLINATTVNELKEQPVGGKVCRRQGPGEIHRRPYS